MTGRVMNLFRNFWFLLFLAPVIFNDGCRQNINLLPVATDPITYRNPVIPGFNPDPSVCRVGEDYYLVTSSFEFFPGVPVYHSRDLVHWKLIGYCLTRKEQLNLEGMGLWQGIYAPVIRYHDGLFYMVTTLVGGGGNFYVTATDPAGPWSDPVWVDDGQFDPSLFFDDDGKVYYTRRGPTGIVQAEIDPGTGKLVTPLREISRGLISRDAEGPHIYKINGWYYLMMAEGGTRFLHMETIARSRDPWGPFKPCPFNPILAQHEGYSNTIRSTGHAELIQAHDDSWWMVFLATRHTWYDGLSNLGRETFLAPVRWKDGWPYVDQKYMLDLDVRAKTLPVKRVENESKRDEFTSDKLGMVWMHLRNPLNHTFSLTEKPGILRLYGNQFALNDLAPSAFIGRKQQHFHCSVTMKLSFLPTAQNEEAGLTVYLNDKHHYDFAITVRDGRYCLVVRKTVGDIVTEACKEYINNTNLFLRIRSDERKYYFDYSYQEEGDYKTISEGLSQLITTELASSFTGVMLAMYASGYGKSNTHPAEVEWFEYSPVPRYKTPAVRLELVDWHEGPVLGKGDPGTGDIMHGIEGGSVIKWNNLYHLFTSEQQDDPKWVKMRLGYWTSPDGMEWSRISTLFESSGDFTGTDPRASFWSPMPVFDTAENHWYMTYVAYYSEPDTKDQFRRNSKGRIWMARSEVAGPAGIGGPYRDMGVILKPGDDCGIWEGLQGTDSFYPFLTDSGWIAFFGSAKTEKLPISFWGVGLARSDRLQGPWERMNERNPADFGEIFSENPIVTKLGDSIYIAVMDAQGEGFGYSMSYNGMDWSEMYHVPVTDKMSPWWSEFRTPLCFIEEGDGLFTVFFTAMKEKSDYWQHMGEEGAKLDTGFDSMGMLKLRIVKQ